MDAQDNGGLWDVHKYFDPAVTKASLELVRTQRVSRPALLDTFDCYITHIGHLIRSKETSALVDDRTSAEADILNK